MKPLDVGPLLAAIPKPPVSKGERGYREWYVARKRGEISVGLALLLCEKAGVSIDTIYRFAQTEYVDGALMRQCKRCDMPFASHDPNRRGAPRTTCDDCRNGLTTFARLCAKCGALFQTNGKQRKYCTTTCQNRVSADVQRENRRRRRQKVRRQTIDRPCGMCQSPFTVKAGSRAKFCQTCRELSSFELSGWESMYPMCPGCGADKHFRRATCGEERCKSMHKSAKGASQHYNVSPEELMVLRSCPRCEACKEPFEEGAYGNLDHCHATGKVRGILCSPCNTALGFSKESPKRLRMLADFIEGHR